MDLRILYWCVTINAGDGMETQLPKRKHPRLSQYDYSSDGMYYVTICTHGRRCLLSNVVGRGLAPAALQYTVYGEIARRELLALPTRYPFLTVDRFAIMPNHIHVLFVFDESAGASPRPTLMDIVCAYKSITTAACKKYRPISKLFQDSFYEHIVRGENDYDEIARYIEENPAKWELDELYIPR